LNIDPPPSTASASASLPRTAQAFFDEFDRAFATFNGAVVAARYAAPYLAVRSDGSSECFVTNDAIATYFQRLLDHYRRQGCRTCRHRDLRVVEAGSAAAFATVTWRLSDDDGRSVHTWRESYNLLLSNGRFRVCASVSHSR